MSYDRGTVTTKAAQRRHRKIRQGTFDEEVRRNMFGPAAKALAGQK
jgi:hypothetical protein